MQTFSRTGLLVSFIGITCLIFYKNLFYGLIWSITILFGLLLSFSYLAASDQGLILKFLESDFGLNNPRIVYAVQALSRLEFTFQFFFGNGFFITPTDNTLVGLISGRGAVGVILYSLLLFLLLSNFSYHNQNNGLFISLIIVILLSVYNRYVWTEKIIYFSQCF